MRVTASLLIATALAGSLVGCGDDEPAPAAAGYAAVGPDFCRDFDAPSLFEDSAAGVSWTSSPERVATGVDPVVCTFEGISSAPASIQNQGPDPGVYLTVHVAKDRAEARECYAQELEDLADAQAPETGGAAPTDADGWWDEGRRQEESQRFDSGLPAGQPPAEVGRTSVKYVVRSDNVCVTARVADQAFDAADIDTRLQRGDALLAALLDRLHQLLQTA